MSNINVKIHFKSLPLWKGVQNSPGVKETLPFSLGWDQRGFICQTTPKKIQQKVIEAYASDEYAFITQPPGSSVWANRLGDGYISFIKRTTGSLKGKTILEIGAGSLYLADQLTDENNISEYIIMDPAVKELPKKPNIHVLREYFKKEKCPDKDFDLVIVVNCLEHMLDPVAFLIDLQNILTRACGKAILVFPNNERQLRNGDLNAILHEHLSYFTVETAIRLFSNCGLRVLEYETEFDSFCFLVEAKEVKSFFPVAMDNILSQSAIKFHQNKDCVRKNLRESLAKGEIVALHGACNGLNNALALADLQNAKNLWVFDGDETKTGKFLPACQTPIRHSEDIAYTKVDRVFIAATTFYTEINEFLISRYGIKDTNIHPLFPLGITK